MSSAASGSTAVQRSPLLSPPCPACSSTNPPLHDTRTHASVCPDCGVLRSPEDVLTATPDFSTDIGYGTHSGTLDDWGVTAGLFKTMREAKRRGAGIGQGHEASQAQKHIVQRQALGDIRQQLNVLLARIDGSAATHPLAERIFNTFKTLRARCQDEEQLQHLQSFLSYRNRIVRFTWGRNAQAALVACVYAVFRADDILQQDAALHRCHSLAAVAHAAEAPLRRSQKWFRALRILMSDVFPRVKADEPIFYVDDIVQALRDGSNPHLAPSQRRLIAATDIEQVRLTSRRLCHQVLQTVSFAEDSPAYRSQSGISLGEWAYYAVLWAMSAQAGHVLKGNVWLKTEREGARAAPAAPDSHIAAYHCVGQAIAQRAACIPWALSGLARSRRKRRTNDEHTPLIKDDEIPKYIKHVIDFGPSVEERFDESRRQRLQQQRQKLPHSSPPPPYAQSPPPPASYTSQHHPNLSLTPSLIDTMTDDDIDATLFTPDEMDSYLRTTDEVDVVRKTRGDEWDQAPSGRVRLPPPPPQHANYSTVINGRPTKTKADERLLAFALGRGSAGRDGDAHDAGQWDQWSDSEDDGDGSDDDDDDDDEGDEDAP